MRITFDRNEHFERYLESIGYSRVKQLGERVTYEGMYELGIARQVLKLNSREFKRFCERVEVEGGRRKKEGDHLIVTPMRNRVVPVRLSSEEYSAVVERAGEYDIDVSKYIRGLVLKDIVRRRRVAQPSQTSET